MERMKGESIKIVALAQKHVPALAKLEAEIFSDPWSAKAYGDLLERDYCHYLVAEAGEEILGFAGMTVSFEEGDIDKVMVAPEARRMGIADRLLDALFELGQRLGVQDYTLEVRKSNLAAIQLYKKHGFREEGVRPRFYAKPTEDALIMWKRHEEA